MMEPNQVFPHYGTVDEFAERILQKQLSFPVMHKVGKGVIFVLLLSER